MGNSNIEGLTPNEIKAACKYIDKYGVHGDHDIKSKSLIVKNHNPKTEYPIKYVVAVAMCLKESNKTSEEDILSGELPHDDITKKIKSFNYSKAKNYFKSNRSNNYKIIDQKDTKGDAPTFEEKIKNFSDKLEDSKNLILHGAPGTGKSFLAKSIAAHIISNGSCKKYKDLSDEEKKRIEFVQFHPSYDYSDFVEGLRPKLNNGSMVFELQDGIFKSFVKRAQENCYEYGSKKYVFIIDEINRGEIAKIFGELFFAIDPEYRGEAGKVSTQYSNLHEKPEDKFYIPENVYIIGTMNDIDRSVDSFDFAMRRRFRFIELKADKCAEMLNELEKLKGEAINRMSNLNKEITETEGLNENYQIGAAYFLKLKNIDNDNKFDILWEDYLQPLLQEYIRGMYNENEIMDKFEKAYKKASDDSKTTDGERDEPAQN